MAEQPENSSNPKIQQEVLKSLAAGGNLTVGDITINNVMGSVAQPTQVHLPINELIQQVRSHCCDKIQNLYSTVQLLNCQQIEVEQLYVDVYVLEKLSSKTHAKISDLVKDAHSREHFDRLGLGKRQRRSPGLKFAAQFPRQMILGKPGSGKSTFLKHLAIGCCRGMFQANCIPIVIELRFFNDASQFNLLSIIHQEFGLTDRQQTEQILNLGKTLILLDGLDEVPENSRRGVQEHIHQFSKRYYKNRFILTCRIQTTEYTLPMFNYVEVADFSLEQVENFAQNWFAATAETPEQGAELAAQLLEKLRLPTNQSIAELMVTPILLSLACWIFSDAQDLPSKRSDLFEQGLQLLLAQWDETKGIQRELGNDLYHNLSVVAKQKLLSYIAARKFEQTQHTLFEQQEIQQYIAEHLAISQEDSQAVLIAIATQHGLLIERAQGIWSFSHLTFQEYLTARTIISNEQPLDESLQSLLQHIYDKRWREVFLLVAEMFPCPDIFLYLMKQAINRSAAQYSHLQEILMWASQKARTVAGSHQPATTRAFYLALAMGIHVIDTAEPPWFEDWLLAEVSDLLISLDKRICLNFYHGCGTGYGVGHYKGSLDGDLAIDFDLCHARVHTSLLGRVFRLQDDRRAKQTNEENEDMPLLDDTNFYEIDSSLCAVLNASINSKLAASIKLLDDRLPQGVYENWKAYEEWCRAHSTAWAEDLRALSRKYRNVDHRWQFNNERLAVLRAYCYASQLLLDCLNNSDAVSAGLRLKIKATLLLPLSNY